MSGICGKYFSNTENLYSSTTIFADDFRFLQIVNNLVTNAIKFTEKGIIEIGVHSTSKQEVVFYVKDSGIGISNEDQKIIFDRFTKIEDNTKFFRGVGLGLAISKQLTDLMNGRIWMESTLGLGSTFYFSFPASAP